MVIFKGSGGVRAGWRFAAYLALVIVLNFAFGYAVGALTHAFHVSDAALNALAPVPMILGELTILVPVVLATWILARFERRSILSYGFAPSAQTGPRFWEGVALGVASAGIVALLMLAFGGMQIHGFALHGLDWIVFPVGWAAVMLMVGFGEEAAFRGYPLFALTRGIGFWPAALVLTALFGAAHLNKTGENAVDIGSVVFIGLFLCFTLWKTGSLWLAAGFHFAFDFMQFFVIGTRNGSQTPVGTLFNASFPGPAWINGGPLGTEASFFIFPVTLALFAYVAWRFRAAAWGAAPNATDSPQANPG